MALIANMGQDFVITAIMDAAAAATFTIANPADAIQASTGVNSFIVRKVEIQWMATAPATSTVNIQKLSGAVTTALFATVQFSTFTQTMYVNKDAVTEVYPDTTDLICTLTGGDDIIIVTADAATQVKVRIHCSISERPLTVT
jgi:hypothetical protein